MNQLSVVVPLLTVALALAGPAGAGAAGSPEPYIQARIEFSSLAEWEEFIALPDLDIMRAKPGRVAELVTDARGLEELVSLGFSVTVVVEDMESFYASRIRGHNFGDFHTFSETVDFLDELHSAYPGITTDKISLGTTFEGRDVWAMRISDNPDAEEDEPEVLIFALHHAREPAGLEATLHYMSWLCENYTTDSDATFLVDSRQIWFVPVVNADGYCFNEDEQPGGGGMWRKNRADYGFTCVGVDPNRNYPYAWGEEGSSGDPCSNTYRGPAPASELEVQALIDLMIEHEFVSAISFHSVVGAILVPWSHTSAHTEDDELLREIAEEMARYNGYEVGQCFDVIHYYAAGTTCDYAYGEEIEKNKIMAFCIEVGGSGFWPGENEIPGLVEECLWPQIYLTRISGSYVSIGDVWVVGGNDDGEPDPGETLDLVVSIENEGLLASVENVEMRVATDDPYVRLHSAVSSLGTVPPGGTVNNLSAPISLTIDPETPEGHALVVSVIFSGDGFEVEKQLDWLVGTPVTLFFDDMEHGSDNWVGSDGQWALTDFDSHSPSYSLTDSPVGFYGTETDTWIELVEPIDLSQAATARLSFWHIFSTAGTGDPCCVEVSSDGGATWTRLAPVFWGTIESWRREEYSLCGYAGTDGFKVRFRLVSDWFLEFDGWYVDDVSVVGPPAGNVIPTAPVCAGPSEGSAWHSANVVLAVGNAADPDPGAGLTYGFLVYADEYFTQEVASVAGVPEGSERTEWAPDVELPDGIYRWRCYADDGTTRGPLMEGATFVVDSALPQFTTLTFFAPSPNPFAGETELAFDMAGGDRARLSIYSIDGRLVKMLHDGEAGPGLEIVRWDGRDANGWKVASGLYLARLEAGGDTKYRKVLALR